MGYTMSFEASVKVQRGQVAGLLRHNGRDVDREQGREVRHSNQDINPALTATNETLVSDGKGGWRPCDDLGEIEAALDARLAAVKKPLRKDAVVLRPLILQLDPAWYAAHPSEDDRAAAAEDMLAWAADTFGAENLVYVSLHLDEENPHLHLGFCPVTEDGRLAQKDWFPGPTALRKMHQDLRQHMTDAGYDIDMKNRKPGKYAKRMEVQEYKDFQDLQAEARKIDSQQGQLSRWAERLHEQQTEQQAREKNLQEREKALQDLEKREKALEGRRRLIEAREKALPGLAAQAAKEAVQREIEASQAAHRRPSSTAAREAAAEHLQEELAKMQATCDAVELHQQAGKQGKTLSL